MKTRLQSRREQSSQMVASPGVNNPRRYHYPLQGHADVADTNDVGGNQEDAAFGDSSIDSQRRQDIRHNLSNPLEHVPKRCQRQRCVTCDIFEEGAEFRSTMTDDIYRTINKRNCPLNCATENVIYLIECMHCKIQYVGETCQQLSHRLSDHRSRIRTHNTRKKETLLIEHFTTGMCAGRGFTARIIETMKKDAKVDGILDATATTIRRKREEIWMEQLRTIYPFGLNNRHGNNQDQRDETDCVSKEFHMKKKNRIRRFYKDKKTTVISANQVFTHISESFGNDGDTPAVLNEMISYVKK